MNTEVSVVQLVTMPMMMGMEMALMIDSALITMAIYGNIRDHCTHEGLSCFVFVFEDHCLSDPIRLGPLDEAL